MKRDFRRVVEMIRESCGLEAPEPITLPSRLTGIEKRLGTIPKTSIPLTLPISGTARDCLTRVEDRISGPAKSSLLSRGSNLLPPLAHQQEKGWYEFQDSTSSSPKGIQRELGQLLGPSHLTLANKGGQSTASELLVAESLALSSLQAASWLDHWVVAMS